MCNDVEILKNSRPRVAEAPSSSNSGVVQSAVFMPPNSSGVGDNEVITGLSWSERMDLEDEMDEDPADNSIDVGVTKFT